MMPSIMSGSLMRDTPPSARMSAGTRSSAMTATAPASSAMRACSAVTTSMITPPLSMSAMPRFTRAVPVWTALGATGAETVAELSGVGLDTLVPHTRFESFVGDDRRPAAPPPPVLWYAARPVGESRRYAVVDLDHLRHCGVTGEAGGPHHPLPPHPLGLRDGVV